MKKLLIGLGVVAFLTGCGSVPVEKTPVSKSSAAEKITKKEKARSNCERVGGTLTDFTREDGSVYSMCTME